MLIGYHASHEQFPPSELLAFVQAAEQGGFQAVMTSDHIAPWIRQQGNSGNNWAWLGAALATTTIPFGTLSIPGGWRYHPVTLAHLIATLAEMFPRRLPWIAVGSGEALNEAVTGETWPSKAERNERLQAGAGIMRKLLDGQTVSETHPWFRAQEAKLWSRPAEPPGILGAALSEDTAGWLGLWADGLITVRKPKPELDAMVSRFRENGGAGKRLALQLQVSWAPTRYEARQIALDQWRNAAIPPAQLAELRRPEDFEDATRQVALDDMEDLVPAVTHAQDILQLIESARSSDFDEIYIHSVSRDQKGFIDFMAREVFPALHGDRIEG
ncbi:TIGR03885 family FMN-dependent LLM class oxidoreductase [Rhizobium sp. YIM 134829]|uniref:TIGR03885 family FMN-dependent LLM class oxidoreductase n=1 Tax=Rhizobium sp. YIM 134829 TaxID=3390453 RepID=UPI00397C808A